MFRWDYHCQWSFWRQAEQGRVETYSGWSKDYHGQWYMKDDDNKKDNDNQKHKDNDKDKMIKTKNGWSVYDEIFEWFVQFCQIKIKIRWSRQSSDLQLLILRYSWSMMHDGICWRICYLLSYLWRQWLIKSKLSGIQEESWSKWLSWRRPWNRRGDILFWITPPSQYRYPLLHGP